MGAISDYDPIELFRRSLETVIELRRAALRVVGGNFVVHVPDECTFTVVVEGPGVGVFDGVIEQSVELALLTTKAALAALLVGRTSEVEAAIESGDLGWEGDFGILERFLGLLSGKSALAIRAGR